MSFRKYGGLQFASKHNAVASYYNTSSNLIVTQNVGQPNSYINFLSDISGNISIYGDFDLSGNAHIGGDLDVSGNTHIGGDVDISGNLSAYEIFLTAPSHAYAQNEVVPKSYVDSAATGVRPLPYCVLCENVNAFPSPFPPTGYNYTIDGITLNPTFDGSAVLINAQGGVDISNNYNGIYIVSNASSGWQRAPYLNTGANATGTATFILQGITYSNYRFVCTTGSNVPPASPSIIGTDPVLWSPFDIPFSLGEGLIKKVTNNNTVISVDPSLNFIQYLDNTDGPDFQNTLNIGNYTNIVNIGKPNGINNKMCVTTTGVGINNNNPSSSYVLDVSGNMRTTGSTYLATTSGQKVGIGTINPSATLVNLSDGV